MASGKQKVSKETSTAELLAYMQEGFAKVNAQFVKIDSQFAAFDTRLSTEFGEFHERLEKVERLTRTLVLGQDSLREQVSDVQRRTVNLEHRVEDIRDTLDGLSAAEENDMKASINHEKRISYLEKVANIQPKPPKHLASNHG